MVPSTSETLLVSSAWRWRGAEAKILGSCLLNPLFDCCLPRSSLEPGMVTSIHTYWLALDRPAKHPVHQGCFTVEKGMAYSGLTHCKSRDKTHRASPTHSTSEKPQDVPRGWWESRPPNLLQISWSLQVGFCICFPLWWLRLLAFNYLLKSSFPLLPREPPGLWGIRAHRDRKLPLQLGSILDWKPWRNSM